MFHVFRRPNRPSCSMRPAIVTWRRSNMRRFNVTRRDDDGPALSLTSLAAEQALHSRRDQHRPTQTKEPTPSSLRDAEAQRLATGLQPNMNTDWSILRGRVTTTAFTVSNALLHEKCERTPGSFCDATNNESPTNPGGASAASTSTLLSLRNGGPADSRSGSAEHPASGAVRTTTKKSTNRTIT